MMTLPLSAQFRSDAFLTDESETVQALRGHVAYLSSRAMEGRQAGSEGEKEAAAYLYDRFKEYGVDLLCSREGQTFGVKQPAGDTLTSRNIVGFLQGYDPALRDRYIVIGARLDNLGPTTVRVDGAETVQYYPGANGNASGVAMLAELARMISAHAMLLRRSVLLIGFGGSREALAGSWYFLNRAFSEVSSIDAMVDLEALGAGEELYAYAASNADLSKMVSAIELPPVKPVLTTLEPFPSDLRNFYACQIPSVLFTRGLYPQYDTPRDTADLLDYSLMERELETIYSFVRDLVNCEPAPDFISVPESDGLHDKVYSYDAVDVPPSFMGRADLRIFMEKWVYPYLKYPPEAVDNHVQGTVNVRFIVDRKGNVTDVHVVKPADVLLDAEAVKVISASPRWKPGRVNGKTVACRITVPVEFKLTDKGTFDIKK